MENKLQSVPTPELTEIVEMFPWFNAARVELCLRKYRSGEAGLSDAAICIGSRSLLFRAATSGEERNLKDSSISEILKEAPKQKVRAVGGDFFSQNEYDDVRQEGDNVFANMVRNARPSRPEAENSDIMDNFCTETLASLYVEQGYYEQAKCIYSKLILLYPEKNAYFAALIEKLTRLEEIKN